MLDTNRILNITMTDSKTGLYNQEWMSKRIGRFTASEMHKIVKERGLGDTGMAYIRTRVYETIARTSASPDDVFSDAIAHGLANENHALQQFGQAMKLNMLVVQKMVVSRDSELFTATPDAISVVGAHPKMPSYEAHTVETKCLSPEKHMKMIECENAEDLYSANPEAFWQVVSQMDVCDVLKGYAVFYHPSLPINDGGLHVIEFRKSKMSDRFRFLRERKELAVGIYNQLLTRNKNKKILWQS